MPLFWNLEAKGLAVKRSVGAIAAIVFLLSISPNLAAAGPRSLFSPNQSSIARAHSIRDESTGGDSASRLPATGTTLFFPLVANFSCNGLYGYVSDHGVKAQGVPLGLWFYDSTMWSQLKTGSTDTTGHYCFSGIFTLLPGQAFYVRYGPQNSNSSRLSAWATHPLTSYSADASVNVGDFDLADIPLLLPDSGATVSLPQQFTWTKRAGMSSDSYEFNLFDPTKTSLQWPTARLGYTDNYTLTKLPPGFSAGMTYAWYVAVWGPDGGYGTSFHYSPITFLNTGAGSPSMETSVGREPVDRVLRPPVAR